jgi:hypothetical protein
MQMGASITSALTPILPQLVAAKVAVEAIEMVTSLGGIF